MQEAYCVRCPEAKYKTEKCKGKAKCTVFHSKMSKHVMPDQQTALAKQCLPKAFASDGTIKAEFECTGNDAKLAAAAAMAF